MPRSFVHLLNPVAVPKQHSLYNAQRVTFAAIEQAWNNRGDIDVELRTAQYKEDREIIPHLFSSTPDLDRSILDDSCFNHNRKLPFLSDILDKILKYSSAEYAIFTNVDIILSENFYKKINEIIGSGNIAFTINRRTISKFPNTPERLDEILSQEGKRHPGHDCFIFPRLWIEDIDVGKIIIGVPWVGFILLANIACHVNGCNIFQDMKLTRHLGDDAEWIGREHIQYRNYNACEALHVLTRLQERYGRFLPESYLGKHVELAVKQVKSAGMKDNNKSIPAKRKKGNRLIFCLSPGRCGTEYLKRILGSCKDVSAFHEPFPQMHGEYLDMVMNMPLAVSFDKRLVKARALKETINHLPPGKTYTETSHMFIKTFYDVIIDSFPNDSISVIILRRNPAEVLKSFISMGYLSEKNSIWPSWMHKVPSELSSFKPYKSFENMDIYDRTISYLFDIEIKACEFKKKYPYINTLEITLENLQDIDSVNVFLSELWLEPTPYTENIVGEVINSRQKRKNEISIKTDYEYCRERIREYIIKSKENKIKLPTYSQFQTLSDA